LTAPPPIIKTPIVGPNGPFCLDHEPNIMSRRCTITGKGVLAGNNVSHAHNRSRRRFLPNIQRTSLLSDILGRSIRLRLSTSALRTIEKNGGLDAFLLGTPDTKLPLEARQLKRKIKKAAAARV
jgi:large subunit ribosomal protein L28